VQIFELSEKELQPGCCAVRVEGELDLAVADRLQRALEKAAGSYDRVLVDLGACEFIDSTGIATILQARSQMAEKDQWLAIFGASNQVDRILSITGLAANNLVFATADEALAAAADVAG
jgi:anti-sigma B factor antagonist